MNKNTKKRKFSEVTTHNERAQGNVMEITENKIPFYLSGITKQKYNVNINIMNLMINE